MTRDISDRSAGRDTFRYLVEDSPFGVYVVDAEFRLIHVSAGAQKVFANVRPLLGRDFAEVLRIIWPEPFASEAIGRFQHTLTTGEPHHAPHTVVRRHDVDEEESYDWKIERVPLPDGSFGVVCHFYDLSERQRYEQALRESEQRFKSMADTAPAMLWITDADQQSTFISRGWCEFTGQTPDEAEGFGWTAAIHPDDREHAAQTFLAAAKQRATFALDYRVRTSQGKWRWVVDAGRPRFDASGKFLGYIGSVIDVHERKHAEGELQRLNAELNDANRRKDEFLAMLGHELRNPLAAIHNATALLKLLVPENARLQQIQAVLERQSTHMARLVDGLLEVSRIVRGKIQLNRETLDLGDVIRTLVQDRVSQIEARGLALSIVAPPEPSWVFADRVRLAQIFDNLLGNAIKFTQAPGRIILTMQATDGSAVIQIRDTGVGIRPELLEQVFEPFRQETQEIDRGTGGLGLGLALAKGLVELHGGSIRARSSGPGTGAEFEVRLPLAAAPTIVRTATQTAEFAPLRVLIVEDNPDAGQTLHALLEALGHEVSIAETGPRALHVLQTRGVDLVLCDLGLPGMSGYDLARVIRSDASLQRIRLVALTGYGQPEDRQRSADAGFDDHLTKPVDLGQLSVALARRGH